MLRATSMTALPARKPGRCAYVRWSWADCRATSPRTCALDAGEGRAGRHPDPLETPVVISCGLRDPSHGLHRNVRDYEAPLLSGMAGLALRDGARHGG